MTFTPLVQRPWGTKRRTLAWKFQTAIIWLIIIAAIWLGAFSYLMSLKPTGENAGAIIGKTLGAAAGVLIFVGWLLIATRPSIRKSGGITDKPAT